MKKILIILTGVLLVWNEPVMAKNEIAGIQTAMKVQKAKKKAKKGVKKAKKKSVKVKRVKKVKVKSYRVRYNVKEIQSYAHNLVLSYGWSEQDYQALVLLWNRESGWNPYAVNRRSGACGIPQSLPCSKMAKYGKDYRINYRVQVRWGIDYIKARYGNPSKAWQHSQRRGWY